VSKAQNNRPGDAESEGAAQVLAATRAARGYAHRRRLGLPGTEPYEVRRPVWRGYAAECLGIAAVLLVVLASVQAGAAVALVALAVGMPRTWLWANDRASAFSWGLAVVLLAAGEIAWLAGGTSARHSLSSKGDPGAAALLIGVCGFVALLGYFRRWGTSGNVLYTQRMLGRDDPEAGRATAESAEREGWRPPDPGA
jgi:hypothetical protein